MTWKKAASVAQLDSGPAVFHHSPKQIALFKAGGQVYAVDNRCPHEGYPLAQGHVDDNCVLTCNWHNWKFRLQDGKCILGGDHVRGYPVKNENGDLWVWSSGITRCLTIGSTGPSASCGPPVCWAPRKP